MSLIRLGGDFLARDPKHIRMRAVEANIRRITAELETARDTSDQRTMIRLERDLAVAQHALQRIKMEGAIIRALAHTPRFPCPTI